VHYIGAIVIDTTHPKIYSDENIKFLTKI